MHLSKKLIIVFVAFANVFGDIFTLLFRSFFFFLIFCPKTTPGPCSWSFFREAGGAFGTTLAGCETSTAAGGAI